MTTFSYKLKTIPTKGKLVYEYNPLYNFRLSEDRQVGKNTILKNSIYNLDSKNLDGLNFDLNHPVDITCQNSYDGSVNLILNDGKNTPKLINSRFSARENNTYEVVDREGTNVTNIYDENLFESDTSLYKKVNKIPKIDLYNVSESGSFKVGNYVFYLTYSDADDNETDFVAESGIVSCFVGANACPSQINGGYKDWDSHKAITFKISNIDRQYDYIRIYYSRISSDVDQNPYTSAFKILEKYPINSSLNFITITGNESVLSIPLSDLNIQYFLASSVKTLVLCKNRLFFGNVTKVTPENKELKDLSLRIYPSYKAHNAEDTIGKILANYLDTSTKAEHKYAYYEMRNIYNYVGYWPEEIYRFGIVYILKDGSLSPVYNILGVNNLEEFSEEQTLPAFQLYLGETRHYLPIDEATYNVDGKYEYNSKGVVKFPDFSKDINNNVILSIMFTIPLDVVEELKKHTLGYFFVRQKRIPTILCQGITLETDMEAHVPIVPLNEGVIESFINSSRILTQDRTARMVKATPSQLQCACICPDYDVNEAYLNQIFTGAKFFIKLIGEVAVNTTRNTRLLDMTSVFYLSNTESHMDVIIAAVQDSAPIVALDDFKFRGRCGEEGDASKFRYIGAENKESSACNLVRGLYGKYLGIGKHLPPKSLINIYVQGYDPTLIYSRYYKERFEDNSQYYAISNRLLYPKVETSIAEECFRGDSYIATETHRLNRNFLDPGAPLNDIIIEPKTWRNNYDVNSKEKCGKINRGDVNAIKLGTWFAMTVRSTRNLGLRSVDLSYPSELGMFGHPRGFYPYQGISAGGDGKILESGIFNAGFQNSVGERWHYVMPSMPYIKNVFLTRIAYSDIAINDAFKNGYRVFLGGNYRDYTYEYGGIVKLIEYLGNIVCVFEHGVALIPVNERTLLSGSTGGDIFINTHNILPETPLVISDMFGSLWPESVIKTPKYIYGVDTIAKKIWRSDGKSLVCISDFKVLRFLNENISLGEFEMTPIIGVRNVKTHYNAFKQDVMFTFYDNTKDDHEVAWNLCFNELTEKFVTFYSWMPSYSENIHNIFFSFDRDASKVFTQLARSKTDANEADGITVDSYDIADWKTNTPYLSLVNRNIPEYEKYNTIYTYSFGRDRFGNYNKFEIASDTTGAYLNLKSGTSFTSGALITLKLNCKVELVDKKFPHTKTTYGTYTNTITLTYNLDDIEITNWFWKHGQAGIFTNAEKIKPTMWYGKQHPFEFEFIVNTDNPSGLKIFNNLKILSNNVAPDSIHFEIIGDGYEFSNDKNIMYYRLEATKCLYYNLGSNVNYDYNYLQDYKDNKIQHFLLSSDQFNKATLFPLTYYRLDKLDEIKDTYGFAADLMNTFNGWNSINGYSRDYKHLAGAEITHDTLTNQYKIWNHLKVLPIKKYGRLRGNVDYKEDNWDILINPLIFVQKNEQSWTKDLPPIAIVGSLPNDILTTLIVSGALANTDISLYDNTMVDTNSWGNRKETRLRDKNIRIRVRYTGEDLTIINALTTLYTISYA